MGRFGSQGGLPSVRPFMTTVGVHDQIWTFKSPAMATVRPDLALAARSMGCLNQFQSMNARTSTTIRIRPPTVIPVHCNDFLSVGFMHTLSRHCNNCEQAPFRRLA